MAISSAQCRMARAALEIGVRDLALLAKVSPNTIARLERGESLYDRTLAAIRAALESAGVEFIAENGGGAGVRLKKERFGMNTSDETYRGHRLVVLLHRDGWKVSIGNTGMETGLHSEPSGALKEARVYVDKVLSARS